MVQVPICEPSAEQTDSPAVGQEAVAVEEGCCTVLEETVEGRAGAMEGERAVIVDGAAGMVELSVGGAVVAGEGTTAATFSSNGTAREGTAAAAAADDEGCTAEDTLD